VYLWNECVQVLVCVSLDGMSSSLIRELRVKYWGSGRAPMVDLGVVVRLSRIMGGGRTYATNPCLKSVTSTSRDRGEEDAELNFKATV